MDDVGRKMGGGGGGVEVDDDTRSIKDEFGRPLSLWF